MQAGNNTGKYVFFNLRLLTEMRECAPTAERVGRLSKKIQKIFKKTVTFSVFADYIYRTFNKAKIRIFARFIYTFAFAVFRSGVLRYNFCTRQTSAPFSRIVYLIWQPQLSTPIKVQRQGDILCRCAPFRDTRINIRAEAERQPLCGQFNLQKNKIIDLIIALWYNEAVKSGIENI